MVCRRVGLGVTLATCWLAPAGAVAQAGGSPVARVVATAGAATQPAPVCSKVALAARAEDGAGNGVAGRQITFAVSGANPASGSAVTDAGGAASFAYAGTAAGTDTVTVADAQAGRSATVTVSWSGTCPSSVGPIDLGGLASRLFVFTGGSGEANWQSASKGYAGDVAVDGLAANQRSSGTIPYAGTITTNAGSLGAWQRIVAANGGQSAASVGATGLLGTLAESLDRAFAQIDALAATPGFESRSATSLDGLDRTDGIAEVLVVNVTSAMKVASRITISGDEGDAFVLRWDADADPANGYQGQVKFQSGGAIVPGGDLSAGNFVHVAGDINASGGGTTPTGAYPQGPRPNNGQGALIAGASDFNGGGFFTGYWLTTGDPATGRTASLSNAIFVGGWYTRTTRFSMTSGTSGVHVLPPAAAARPAAREIPPPPPMPT